MLGVMLPDSKNPTMPPMKRVTRLHLELVLAALPLKLAVAGLRQRRLLVVKLMGRCAVT
jgi:hypothetical protein